MTHIQPVVPVPGRHLRWLVSTAVLAVTVGLLLVAAPDVLIFGVAAPDVPSQRAVFSSPAAPTPAPPQSLIVEVKPSSVRVRVGGVGSTVECALAADAFYDCPTAPRHRSK